MVRYDSVWLGEVRYGMVRYGMVRFGMVSCHNWQRYDPEPSGSAPYSGMSGEDVTSQI